MRRLARAGDLEAVHAIFMDPAVNPFLGYERMALEEFRPIFADFVAGGRFHAFEHEGKVAGFYSATRFPGRGSHVAELGALAVAPALHGSGVAEAMLADAIAMLTREGVTRIELRADADNPRGLAFYRKMGFEIEGLLRRAFKRRYDPEPIDDVLMARRCGGVQNE